MSYLASRMAFAERNFALSLDQSFCCASAANIPPRDRSLMAVPCHKVVRTGKSPSSLIDRLWYNKNGLSKSLVRKWHICPTHMLSTLFLLQLFRQSKWRSAVPGRAASSFPARWYKNTWIRVGLLWQIMPASKISDRSRYTDFRSLSWADMSHIAASSFA